MSHDTSGLAYGRPGCARRVVHPTISVLSSSEQLLQPTVIREHWATVVLRLKNTHVGNKFEWLDVINSMQPHAMLYLRYGHKQCHGGFERLKQTNTQLDQLVKIHKRQI